MRSDPRTRGTGPMRPGLFLSHGVDVHPWRHLCLCPGRASSAIHPPSPPPSWQTRDLRLGLAELSSPHAPGSAGRPPGPGHLSRRRPSGLDLRVSTPFIPGSWIPLTYAAARGLPVFDVLAVCSGSPPIRPSRRCGLICTGQRSSSPPSATPSQRRLWMFSTSLDDSPASSAAWRRCRRVCFQHMDAVSCGPHLLGDPGVGPGSCTHRCPWHFLGRPDLVGRELRRRGPGLGGRGGALSTSNPVGSTRPDMPMINTAMRG